MKKLLVLVVVSAQLTAMYRLPTHSKRTYCQLINKPFNVKHILAPLEKSPCDQKEIFKNWLIKKQERISYNYFHPNSTRDICPVEEQLIRKIQDDKDLQESAQRYNKEIDAFCDSEGGSLTRGLIDYFRVTCAAECVQQLEKSTK